MTEISCYLNSQPMLFCTFGASIFALQAHSIQQTFMKQEITKTVIPILAVFSYVLLFPADTFMKQELQSIISPLGKFSSHCSMSPACQFIQQSRQEQFLAQMVTSSIRSVFNAHLPLEVDWCCQEQMCLTVIKSSEFLNIFNAIF